MVRRLFQGAVLCINVPKTMITLSTLSAQLVTFGPVKNGTVLGPIRQHLNVIRVKN